MRPLRCIAGVRIPTHTLFDGAGQANSRNGKLHVNNFDVRIEVSFVDRSALIDPSALRQLVGIICPIRRLARLIRIEMLLCDEALNERHILRLTSTCMLY